MMLGGWGTLSQGQVHCGRRAGLLTLECWDWGPGGGPCRVTIQRRAQAWAGGEELMEDLKKMYAMKGGQDPGKGFGQLALISGFVDH